MAQANGVGLERSSHGDAPVTTGHDGATAALGVARAADPVDIQVARIGAGAATVLLHQIVQAIDHLRT